MNIHQKMFFSKRMYKYYDHPHSETRPVCHPCGSFIRTYGIYA